MKLFSGSASKELGEKISEELRVPLSPVDIFIFPDGERRVRIAERVVDEHCVIVQSASTPVDEHYMELFFLIDSLKRSGASQITIVIPYFGYQRQDHVFRSGEAVSLEVIIRIFQSLKVDRVISIDMHSSRIPDLFPSTIQVTHLSALPLFAERIRQEGWDTDETVLVSPDMGGIRRVKQLSEMLDDMNYIATEKNRDLETGILDETNIGEGTLKHEKRAIIVDDMISSGKTIAMASDLLAKNNLMEVYTFATHPVFSPEAPTILTTTSVKKVFVTDTVFIPREKQFPKLEILSMSKVIATQLQSA